MNTIERYIFRRAVIACVGSTLAIVAMVWTSQAVTRIDFATGTGSSILTFLHFMALLIPQFLVSVLPFGIVVGCVQVLNAMNLDSEMPVLSSAGLSRWGLAKPFLFIGLLCAAYVFVSSHLIEPYTNAKSRDILTQARSDLLTTLIQEGRFTKADKNLTIYVDKKTPDGLQGIMISDTREPKLSLIYYAQTGAVGTVGEESLLVMRDGQIHRKTPDSDDVTVIQFQSYAISLSQFSNANGKSRYFVYERPTSYLMNPDPNDSFFKLNPGNFSAELHSRMTSWLYQILMVLVALVLAGAPASHRGSNFINYVLSFGAALGYYGLAQVAYNLNKVTADTIFLIYLIPIAGIVASAWMYATGRSVRIPGFVLKHFDRSVEWFRNLRLNYARKAIKS